MEIFLTSLEPLKCYIPVLFLVTFASCYLLWRFSPHRDELNLKRALLVCKTLLVILGITVFLLPVFTGWAPPGFFAGVLPFYVSALFCLFGISFFLTGFYGKEAE